MLWGWHKTLPSINQLAIVNDPMDKNQFLSNIFFLIQEAISLRYMSQ